MSEHKYFFDKESLHELGLSLWKIRQDRRLYLHQLEKQSKIPAKIIDGIETGRSFHYGAARKLIRFYGKKLRLSLDE